MDRCAVSVKKCSITWPQWQYNVFIPQQTGVIKQRVRIFCMLTSYVISWASFVILREMKAYGRRILFIDK